MLIFQKNPAVPGACRRDQINFLQDAQHPQGDILQVTDRESRINIMFLPYFSPIIFPYVSDTPHAGRQGI